MLREHEQVTRLRTIMNSVMGGGEVPMSPTEDGVINTVYSAAIAESVGNGALFSQNVVHNQSLLNWAAQLDDAEIAFLLSRRRVRA